MAGESPEDVCDIGSMLGCGKAHEDIGLKQHPSLGDGHTYAAPYCIRPPNLYGSYINLVALF
jgi:hypothetical protein